MQLFCFRIRYTIYRVWDRDNIELRNTVDFQRRHQEPHCYKRTGIAENHECPRSSGSTEGLTRSLGATARLHGLSRKRVELECIHDTLRLNPYAPLLRNCCVRWLEKTLRAHQRCISSLHHSAGGLVTGGKDGFVKLWSTQLAHLRTFDLNEVTPSRRRTTHALDVAPLSGHIKRRPMHFGGQDRDVHAAMKYRETW